MDQTDFFSHAENTIHEHISAHEDAVDGAQMHKAMRALDYRSLLVKPRPVKLYYKLDKEKLTIQLGKHLNEMLFKLI